jgi:preprotein translocase subunit Sss1
MILKIVKIVLILSDLVGFIIQLPGVLLSWGESYLPSTQQVA